VPEWLTIEVLDGTVPASEWRRAYENVLVESAITHGVTFWDWHDTRWGVVLELVFEDRDGDADRLALFRGLPVVQAALDAVPDRLHGLIVYRGRGGGAGDLVPRHPRLLPVAGAAPLPTAAPDEFLRLPGAMPGGEPLRMDLSSR
jgi:hypothetical protein